ncbi:hypothetical protein LXL04_013136 [Taraxacum kok-saghyz]
MVFGKSIGSSSATNCDEEEVEYQEEATVGDEEVSRVQGTEDHTVHTTPNDKQSKGNLNDKPLYEEVTLIGSGTSKNAGVLKFGFVNIVKNSFTNGIPFNVLRNPHFREMISAIKKAPEGYKPPSSEKARTTLLDECVRDVDKNLSAFKDTWYSQGLSIVSDGWTNIKHKPLINVLAVNSRGAMFMYAEDFSGVEKTGLAIADFLNKAIESVGPSNVLSVVTDNAANCKAAGKEVENVYKHIFWSPCCVHTLNLIFKDFADAFIWLEDTYKKGKMIVKYFLNHGQALAIFRENSKLELLNIAKTRFASHYILLKSYLETLAPGGVRRKAPNHDKEVVQGVMEAFSRIAENRDEERMLREQFASFHIKKGLYSLPGAQLDAVTMDAIDWWSTYGAETPELAEVARKVLSQPITSSSAERNWSTYSYIHSVKRNRLTCSRADKLVYVHSNARLCSRFSEAYKEGPHKKWDMNPESTNLENSMLEDMMWDDLDDDDDEDNGRGKRPRVD